MISGRSLSGLEVSGLGFEPQGVGVAILGQGLWQLRSSIP